MIMAMIANAIGIRVCIEITQTIIICVRIAMKVTDTVTVLIYKIVIATDAVTVQVLKTIAEIAAADMAGCWRKLCRANRSSGRQHNHTSKSHSQHFLHIKYLLKNMKTPLLFLTISYFMGFFNHYLLFFWKHKKLIVTFHTHAKVVGIMRQNAKSFSFFTLAFCVQNLL